MGRHTAGDGATVDPLVAAALQGRAPDAEGGEPRHGAETAGHPVAQHQEGPVGWPGEPGDGTGLGWPADPRPTAPADQAEPAAAEDTGQAGSDVPAPRRRGWRRFFGNAAA